MPYDLVLFSLGGVQRFISESRSTADVAGASKIVQRLARKAAGTIADRLSGQPAPAGLIFPAATDAQSVTNKIVFLAAEGAGPALARAAAKAVIDDWKTQLEAAFEGDRLPDTPGMPDLAWVSVTRPVTNGNYRNLWEAAQREMTGRRRARVFEPVVIRQSTLCAQSPGLPAVRPRHCADHEKNEALSAAGWVKREVGREPFPSTVSVASAQFRASMLQRADADPGFASELRDPVRRLAAALDGLHLPSDRAQLRSVPIPHELEALAGRLGAWVTPERWDGEGLAREYGIAPGNQLIQNGHRAAGALATLAQKAKIPLPTPYFAIVVQDLDRLGQALSRLDLDQQREVSQQLNELASQQGKLMAEHHPRAELIYAGGDDLLAFCPATAALPLAEALRAQIRTASATGPLATAGPGGTAITASSAVVFAHMSSPLRDALESARTAIKDAKEARSAAGRSRDALAVVVLRRGGQRARTVQPWWPRVAKDGASAAALLLRIRPGPGADVLSGALASELERDEETLGELVEDTTMLRDELIRLVIRHGGTPQAGDALCTLARSERTGRPFAPVPTALVARFLSQEAR